MRINAVISKGSPNTAISIICGRFHVPKTKASVILFGTHGSRSLRRALMRSDAEAIAVRAPRLRDLTKQAPYSRPNKEVARSKTPSRSSRVSPVALALREARNPSPETTLRSVRKSTRLSLRKAV